MQHFGTANFSSFSFFKLVREEKGVHGSNHYGLYITGPCVGLPCFTAYTLPLLHAHGPADLSIPCFFVFSLLGSSPMIDDLTQSSSYNQDSKKGLFFLSVSTHQCPSHPAMTCRKVPHRSA